MSLRDYEYTMWVEIAKRVEAGETQTALARELGMTVRMFRYRLRKCLEEQSLQTVSIEDKVKAETEAAAATEVLENKALCSDGANSSDQYVSGASEEQSSEHSLFDETWQWRWSVSRLVLLVKEPTTVFAYWEVDEQKRRLVSKHFQTDWYSLPFYLQLYDVTDVYFNGYNAQSTKRIQVHPDADNWYVHDVQPLRNYVMDFGTTTLQGEFFTILRSNVVQTPPEPSYRNVQGHVWFAPLALTRMDSFEGTSAKGELIETIKESSKSTVDVGRPYPNEFDGYSVRIGRN